LRRFEKLALSEYGNIDGVKAIRGIYSNAVDVNGSGEFLTESGKALIDDLIAELVEFAKKQNQSQRRQAMSDQTPIITHEPVNIVLTIENGKVIHARPVQNGEVTASLETFYGWLNAPVTRSPHLQERRTMALTAIRIPEWVHLQAVHVLRQFRAGGFIPAVCTAPET
jgi:hypothetical protein